MKICEAHNGLTAKLVDQKEPVKACPIMKLLVWIPA
jgi:hypothetical protein